MNAKTHIQYHLRDMTIVPGVTTILGILNKPALAPAANKLGLLGINSNIYWRELADIGTLAHYLILCHLKKVKPDTSDYRKDVIDKAENSFLSYLEWEKGHKIEPLLLEIPQVSEEFRYGGTPDIVCHLDGYSFLTLIDLKTGGIYREHYWQMSGYYRLLEDVGYPIEGGIILGIPRTLDESINEQLLDNKRLQLGFGPFKYCLDTFNGMKYYEEAIREVKHA